MLTSIVIGFSCAAQMQKSEAAIIVFKYEFLAMPKIIRISSIASITVEFH